MLVPKIKGAFKGVGGDVADALKNWWKTWKSPIKSPKQITEVLEGPGGIGAAFEDITKLSKGAYERLISNLESGTNEIKNTFLEKLNEAKALRNRLSIDESRLVSLTRSKPNDPDKFFQWEEAISRLEDIIEKSREQFGKLQKELGSANKFVETLDTEGVEKAFNLLNSNPNLMIDFPRLGTWQREAKKQLLDWHTTYRARSFNLDNTKKFIKEYASVMQRPADDPYRMAFLTNTENKNFLSSLRGSSRKIDKLFKTIESPSEKAQRPGLIGSTLDIAKKLGLGVGAVAGSLIGIKIYNWFNSNPPEKTSNTAETIVNNLNNLRTTGAGAKIVANMVASLNKLSQVASQTHSDLGENPEQAASLYIFQLNAELQNLSRLLMQWNIVVINSSDKALANTTGQQLRTFIIESTNSLKNLGNQVGVSVK